ncbi:MAG: hypothetical protein V3U89_08000 [Methylophilaceae bacterium]
MNKYERLQEENQHFWELLNLDNTLLILPDFATLAEEEGYAQAQELAVETV